MQKSPQNWSSYARAVSNVEPKLATTKQAYPKISPTRKKKKKSDTQKNQKLLTAPIRARCRSLWMTSLRRCSARCTAAARSRWPSSTCLTSWTSRRISTASTTRMCGTRGRAIGKTWLLWWGKRDGRAVGRDGATRCCSPSA